MPYTVTFRSSALKQTQKLPPSVAARVVAAAESLANVPRPPGCTKLAGGANLWRVRVGDYRIVYAIEDKTEIVDVRIVAHRREVYRGM
jgi:mRNA interferase RelE/StbE